ncbi:MAG: Sir2 family NAD-dependent protein deacetylase, partial [Planctomycetota bacterium]
MSVSDQAAIDRVAAALVEHRAGYAFTGAGVSVESGIPDFRSAGGIWDRYDPMRYATIQAFKRDPEGVWEFFRELERTLESPSPNPAHEGLARLEALGLIEGIATQNIDGLHQRAGSKNVIELHGSHRQLE